MTLAQLSAADWPMISALLDEALALSEPERATWLQSLDGERALHRETLRTLLEQAAGVETDAFLATLPRLTRVTERGPLTELATGDAIGPYRLLSELGTGGMGAVWLAERSDGSLKRKVALKLPRLVWAKGLAERMARERDILASLEHPHIARLYDAGVDQHGRPYLALEHVEGQPIDVYAKERNLSVRQKLDLLLQVCGAVAFAHSRLVVHRDLKPSNILVTHDGQVRLLDFGIAKLMEGDSAKESQLTQLAGRALTLDYASPEQIKGEPIGTASDVYSLGVVAYELLSGAKPYRLKRGSAAELEEAIATADPPKASDTATGPQDKKALKGDLDAILNKALKKVQGDRYPTIDTLRDDLLAVITQRPVKAQPDGFAYRAHKFVVRNRSAVASAVLLLMVAGAGGVMSFSQYRQTVAERDRAVRALEREEAVSAFMQSLIGDIGTSQPMTAPQLLERSEVLLATERLPPASESAVLRTIALLHSSYGAFGRAQPLLDRAVMRAQESGDRELLGLSLCLQASTAARRGAADNAAATLERLAAEYADAPTAAIACLTSRAYLAQNSNDPQGAIRFAQEALDRSRTHRRSPPAQDGLLVGSLAYGYSLAGESDTALRLYAESIELFRAAGQEDSARAISIWNNWGLAALAAGDPTKALTLFDRTLSIARLRSPDGLPPVYLLANRARTLTNLHRLDEAIAESKQAIALAQSGGNLAVRVSAGVTEADALRLQGQRGLARERLQALDAAARGKLPPANPASLNLVRLKGLLDAEEGRLDEARAGLDTVIETMDARGLRTAATVGVLTSRADVSMRLGQLDAAEKDIDRALVIARSVQGTLPHSSGTGLALLQRSRLKALRADGAGARVDAQEARRQLAPTLGESHPDTLAAARAASS
jgi:serine/threonine-protein kinase